MLELGVFYGVFATIFVGLGLFAAYKSTEAWIRRIVDDITFSKLEDHRHKLAIRSHEAARLIKRIETLEKALINN